MPESPYYLIMKGRKEEAKKSLEFFRRCDVTKDLELLEKDVLRQMSERGSFKELWTIESNRKALFIMTAIRTMQQVSGAAAWGIFTQKVFQSSDSDISAVLSSIIFIAMQVLMTALGSFMVDRFGRRPLIIISSFLTAITLICGAIYFYLDQETDYDLSNLRWMPLVIMLLFVIVFSFGLGTAPTLMLGEMFSASIKEKALCLMCIYYAITLAVVLKIFYVLQEIGMYVPFLLFGICCFINVIVAFWFVPETKGKTLEEIQQELKGNKLSKN